MKKYISDFKVVEKENISPKYVSLQLKLNEGLPEIKPGQFLQVRVDSSPKTFLRRPVSISFVDYENSVISLLIAIVGDGTLQLSKLNVGDSLNCVFPLGNGFTLPKSKEERILLVGGGVGVAPLLYLGKVIKDMGSEPIFLIGARSEKDLLLLHEFAKYGSVYITTEDGSMGEQGFVTDHSKLKQGNFDRICSCGPKPMMQAVAKFAKENKIDCEVSLENLMACGIGACLCCVEKTTKGNLRVCSEGPVFNIKDLLW